MSCTTPTGVCLAYTALPRVGQIDAVHALSGPPATILGADTNTFLSVAHLAYEKVTDETRIVRTRDFYINFVNTEHCVDKYKCIYKLIHHFNKWST